MPSLTLRIADAMRTSGFVDSDMKVAARQAKEHLSRTLVTSPSARLTPPSAPLVSAHASIWMSDEQIEKLLNYGKFYGLSAGDSASTLLASIFAEWEENRPKVVDVSTKASESLKARLSKLAPAIPPREEQLRMYDQCARLLEEDVKNGSVLMCEAGTGIGKTLTYLSFALDLLEKQKTARIYIAVPTFALMAQVKKELKILEPSYPSDWVKAVYLSGQNEWVSQSALVDFLQQASIDGRIDQEECDLLHSILKEWSSLPAQAASGLDPGQTIPWTLDALYERVPNFGFSDEIKLTERDITATGDAGYAAFQHQFYRMSNAHIVVMSHHMLATMTKRRMIQDMRSAKPHYDAKAIAEDYFSKSKEDRSNWLHEVLNANVASNADESGELVFPSPDLLIVDEAHALSDAFHAIFNTYLSVNKILQTARDLAKEFPTAINLSAISEIEKHVYDIKIVAGENSAMLDAPFLKLLGGLIQTLYTPKKSASKSIKEGIAKNSKYKSLKFTHRAMDLVSAAMSPNTNVKAIMHWSPTRKFPRITMGKSNLRREFDFLWTNIAQKSLLVSGTLYEEDPLPSCETSRQKLGVSASSIMSVAPIHAAWQIDPVTIFMVRPVADMNGRDRYQRPTIDADANDDVQMSQAALRKAWIDDVSDYAHRAIQSAKGGTLIACTAFDDITAISKQLEVRGHHLVVQKKGMALSGLRLQFLALCRKAKETSTPYPVLIATGGVWTGFDLHDPEVPNALTDLIVPNSPMGLQTTSMGMLLHEGSKYMGISSHATLLTRQVMGRLVRSPDTPHNRRVHWLDARIHRSNWAGMTSGIRRFLAKYKQVNTA